MNQVEAIIKMVRPMRFEATVEDCLVVAGKIPENLNGGFYRNGPTWRRPTKQGDNGLFSMDGMVQGLVFREGRAEFRNRWIRTPKFVAEERAGRALFEWSDGAFGDYRSWALGDVKRDEFTTGVPQGTNFVNVFPFAGEILTSGEQGCPPIALDPLTLETRGIVPWSPKLARGMVEPACFGDGAFTAHPKWDHETGELYGWSYRDEPPFVTLHWVRPDGSVRSRALHDAPYSNVAHDIWLTERYVVMPFQPFVIDRRRIAGGLSIYGWQPERPIVLALIPRDNIDGEIRWIEADIEPQYIMHTSSANQIGDRLILDGPIFDRPPWQFEDRFAPGEPYVPFYGLTPAVIGRWEVDLNAEVVKSERLDDCPVEFPKVDERHYGKPITWGFFLAGPERGMKLDSLVRRNMHTGEETSYQIARDVPLALSEATFVPRTADAPEGDGYLIVPASNVAGNTAEFLLFDTEAVDAGPITRIHIPFPLGWTPHGHWMSF